MNRIPLMLSMLLCGTQLLAQNFPLDSVSVAGKKTVYRSFGLENRKPGEPLLVFESGLGSAGDNFQPLFGPLSKAMAGFAYDRNGVGGSAADSTLKTDRDVIRRLHDILTALHQPPPYLLIGHSLGGPLMRLFTAQYPTEVAGLVLIDPTDYMLTLNEDAMVKTVSSSKMGYRELWVTMLKEMSMDTNMSAGTRAEMSRELSASTPNYFGEYSNLPPLPDIPVSILIAYNRRIEASEASSSKRLQINIVPWFKELNRLRIDHYADLIAANHHSKLILLPGYSHGVHNQDPELAAGTILTVYKYAMFKGIGKK